MTEHAHATAGSPTPPNPAADTPSERRELGPAFRSELVTEIEAMALYQIAEGQLIDPKAAAVLGRMEREDVPLAELVALHGELAQSSAASPRAILALHQGTKLQGGRGILGPIPAVRRLSACSIGFALTFFAVSLSGEINTTNISLSIYELQGFNLALKLLLVMSAAGLGASFAALFDVWSDLRRRRFDPVLESAYWMQIGLGVVAGLILSEIVASERVVAEGGVFGSDIPTISAPLLALVGGFSASVLHMVMTALVDAFRRVFQQDSGARAEELAEKLSQRLQASFVASDALAVTTATSSDRKSNVATVQSLDRPPPGA